MRKALVLGSVILLLAMAGMPCASCAAGATASTGTETVDPKAKELMQKMGDYMESLQKFEVHSNRIMEVILPNGQKLLSDRSSNLFVQKPDRIRVNVSSAKRELQYYFDGKTFTVYTPRLKYYASVAAKPTIGEMIEHMGDEYDIDFPLADVLSKQEDLMKEVVSGSYVGKSLIQGIMCHQLAFRQKDIDWEVWIEEGEKPLLRRLAIRDKSQKGDPLTVISLSDWDVNPTFDENLFTFTAPQDAHKIKLLATEATEKIQGISKGAKPAKE